MSLSILILLKFLIYSFSQKSESSGQVFDSSAHLGARAGRPLLMRTGTSALLDETENDGLWNTFSQMCREL
jgi:hypothetical protein